MGEKDDEFIFEQFETAARRYPVGSWVPGYETPQRNVKRDMSLAELACRSLRSWVWMPSPRESMQRGIREEHPYFRRPKDSPDVYLNLRPITTLVAALAVGEVLGTLPTGGSL